MPEFTYEAITDSGKVVKGSVEAASEEAARAAVASRGQVPTKVVRGRALSSGGLSSIDMMLTSVKAPELILFTKQFRTLFSAGIAIVQLLEILEEQAENIKLKAAMGKIGQDIRTGGSLYAAFRKHKDIFDELYTAMLRAGEASGNLVEVLERLIYLINHEYKTKKAIQSAMTYPIIVVIMLVGAFFFLLTTVIPKFVTIFKNAKLDLPFPTLVCMKMHQFLTNYWQFLLVGLVASVVGLMLYLRTDQGKYLRDYILLELPLLGPIFRKAAMSRFSNIFALLQSSGISVLEAIDVVTNTIGNRAIASDFERLKERIREGSGIAAPLRKSKYFPPMVINMIHVGEQSGNLDQMLSEISQHYDYEVEMAVERMSQLIGPILILSLAGVVGFFALAIMMPLFDLVKLAH